MLLSIPAMKPRADRVHVLRDNETETWRSDYTERRAGVSQVLLVEQQIPGSKMLSHFHGVDQFQVIVGGHGKLGQHAVGPREPVRHPSLYWLWPDRSATAKEAGGVSAAQIKPDCLCVQRIKTS